MPSLTAHPLLARPSTSYPTRLHVLANPALLARHVPAAWRGRRELAAAVGLFTAAGLTGCHSDEGPSKTGPRRMAPVTAVVAPLFVHGDGRAAGGCIVVAPPVLLSEEDAWRVIAEELQRVGIELSERDRPLKSVQVTHRQWHEGYNWLSRQPTAELVRTSGPLTVDRVDPRRHIAVEFVSCGDEASLEGPWRDPRLEGSTLSIQDIRGAAEYIDKQVNGKPEAVYLGVLYDPCEGRINWRDLFEKRTATNRPATHEEEERARQELEDAAKEKSAEFLRLQVKDFVDWLKAQGAI